MKTLAIVILLGVSINIKAQDTFSIVAIDSVTGEIGSAGASCVPITLPVAPHGALIISDIIPGVGAIHTQAYWLAGNQQNAHARMLAGDTAQQIINWLTLNDVQSNPTIRQYGIVDYNGGHPRSAGYTGVNCNVYRNHITGPGYSIQGNILLGQQILDSMEARYLNTPGNLADKLMAALQGANVVGADTRCAPFGLSSLSSFIRVALPADSANNFHLDLYMAYPGNTSYPVDPIDSLQTLYDNWVNGVSVPEISSGNQVHVFYENDDVVFEITSNNALNKMRIEICDAAGRKVLDTFFSGRYLLHPKANGLTGGAYMYRIYDDRKFFGGGKILIR